MGKNKKKKKNGNKTVIKDQKYYDELFMLDAVSYKDIDKIACKIFGGFYYCIGDEKNLKG